MSHSYFSPQNLKFLFSDIHQAEELTQYPYFSHLDADALEMMLDAAHQLSDKYLYPYFEDMDRNPPELKDGKVRVHHSVREFLNALAEGGWLGARVPMEYGGMQLPGILSASAAFIMGAANNGAIGYPGLTNAAANLLVSVGSEEQKKFYLPYLFDGKWQGTMALTEPQAGSSLSDVSTSATLAKDGSYRIKGQKIYISAGDYTAVENVVHFMLARIEGAPPGTKGISLFIVPKFRMDDQGELVFNDVSTAGLFHKMGQKGTPTVHLIMGENEDCHGYLLGEPHKGLHYMFQMMNEARIGVGLGGASVASAAYYASLKYAQERPQGRRLNDRNPALPQCLIIEHPDVKRMLLLQKSIMEGGLSLILQAAKYADLARVSEGEEQEKYQLLLELLTPIVKTYPSEMGLVSVSNGLQILGGGGFCEDFPLEIYYRDIRIFSIYEGTTGIQSMDLLGRKVTMKQGKAMKLFFKEVQQSIDGAKVYDDLKKYANMLQEEMQKMQEVTMTLVGYAMKGDIERFLADATLFMEMAGIIALAWQWLKQGTVAKQALLTNNPEGNSRDFLEGKLHAMKYFFHYEVPKTMGLAKRLKDTEILTIAAERETIM